MFKKVRRFITNFLKPKNFKKEIFGFQKMSRRQIIDTFHEYVECKSFVGYYPDTFGVVEIENFEKQKKR